MDCGTDTHMEEAEPEKQTSAPVPGTADTETQEPEIESTTDESEESETKEPDINIELEMKLQIHPVCHRRSRDQAGQATHLKSLRHKDYSCFGSVSILMSMVDL